MDLSQTKLTKEEWNNLEIPITGRELDILKLIHGANDNTEHKIINTLSLLDFIKITDDIAQFHCYLFETYFVKMCKKIQLKNKHFVYKFDKIKKKKKNNIKKGNIIRLKNFNKRISDKKEMLIEFIILNVVDSIFNKKDKEEFVYILNYILKLDIVNANIYVIDFATTVLNYFIEKVSKQKYLNKYPSILKTIRKYQKLKSIKLFKHQKQIITTCKKPGSKMVLYQAPTGTGKTLTPLGLVSSKKKENKLRIIFVCAAKHIGLQLAKSCISLEIPIAIAFGCKDPSDIRLHYFAAKEITRNRRTGGIFRVDNSVGDKVEIIISDIQSYLSSMHYMCAFNKPENLLWYWDEPTISLDLETHRFHSILQQNWKENIIPNVVLSSATLPKDYEISNFTRAFCLKFENPSIYNVLGTDYSKTIPLIDSNGYSVLPHHIFDNFEDLKKSVLHIEEYKTLLRHFDIGKICKFILYIHENKYIKDVYSISNYFSSINDITTNSLKEYYLFVLKKLGKKYTIVHNHFKDRKKKVYDSCIKITTEDSHTLTDGPTIFLTDDVKKIALFYLKSSNISKNVMNRLFEVIKKNSVILAQLAEVEKDEDERVAKISEELKDKDTKITVGSPEYIKQQDYLRKLQFLKSKLRTVELPPVYIPNNEEHKKKWKNTNENSFTSDIDEDIVEKIMFLNVEEEWKILLMMGIGVFCESNPMEYKEIMKKLAQQQKLYLIIASSDYIYGTNYQFCHGYLSKDLGNISQEKLIQAIGRVGRSNLQKTYTIRLRNNKLILKLFTKQENKPEVKNMNTLFV